MRVVVQRVKEASVSVSEKIIGLIDHGLVVFVSFVDDDTMDDLDWMSKKIINLRIFSDKDDKMNDSLLDVDGNILLISQFTLHASTKKGNRPSFIKAAKPDFAHDMYQKFIKILVEKFGSSIQTGEFGADMKVGLVNDGPTTIIIDSRDKE
jgi:D-tyrosyl-tRNA(Tyr) deacylase